MESHISASEAKRLSSIRSKSQMPKYTPDYRYDNKDRNVEDGDKKSMSALKWLGIIAAGAAAIGGTVYLIKSGNGKKAVDFIKDKFTKNIQGLSVTKDENGKIVRKIGDKLLTFAKGEDGKTVAKLGDELLTGKFMHQGIIATYKDGMLVSSVKRGANGFTKIYQNGLLSKAKYYDANSKLTKKITASFNENGKIAKLTTLSPKGEVVEDLDFKYNENKELINKDEIKSIVEKRKLANVQPQAETPADQQPVAEAQAETPADQQPVAEAQAEAPADQQPVAEAPVAEQKPATEEKA